MLWDIQKEIFCQQLAQISLQRANNCLYSGRFWFKMPKKHKTSQKVAECKVENLLLSNITSTEVYVQYGCNKFQAQLRLRFHTISPIVPRIVRDFVQCYPRSIAVFLGNFLIQLIREIISHSAVSSRPFMNLYPRNLCTSTYYC